MGPNLYKVKVIIKGTKALYVNGNDRIRAVDKRASTILTEYEANMAKKDRELESGEWEGICQRRLSEY